MATTAIIFFGSLCSPDVYQNPHTSYIMDLLLCLYRSESFLIYLAETGFMTTFVLTLTDTA